jgi:phosphatidylserine decarboxylase
VNVGSINKFDGVFVKNERLVIWIDTESFGRIALVMVGATCVGEMTAAFDKALITNRKGGGIHAYDPAKPVAKGSELGVFHMGSTVVMFFEDKEMGLLAGLDAGQEVQMGQALMQKAEKQQVKQQKKRGKR